MKNRIVTLAELNALKPCKPAEHYLGKGWTGTLLDIMKHPEVRDIDKIWAVTQLVDEKTARLFAVYCARQALLNIPANQIDERAINAIDVAERFANGQATTDELSSAMYAAMSAAYYAAKSVAESDAYHAAHSAAYYAARSAAKSVAYYTANSAAYYAARSAAKSVAYYTAKSVANSAAMSATYSAALANFVKHLASMIVEEPEQEGDK